MSQKINNDIRDVKAEFEEWRSKRSGREKTPEHLRIKAVQLLDSLSGKTICKELKICPNQLRKWRSPSKNSSAKTSTNFIEIAIQQLTANDCQIPVTHYVVIERIDGNRLIVNLPTSKIESLLTTFLRA